MGPRATALVESEVARLPGSIAASAFETREGARFLAEHVASALVGTPPFPSYGIVDELLRTRPLIVPATMPADEVARLVSERGVPCAIVELPDHSLGAVTDRSLMQRILLDGLPVTAPAGDVLAPPRHAVSWASPRRTC
ncbi:hypothetical protein [Arsenicicoccus piscis]|uniref:CBS domain-containing protein n=1 Tax=Arsenicicoccus piscis TaxID=673954 RepID=A0ABQ6HMJ1_9MICO|nr:hypothetical protein [Arsenicicoccus piscis]GMA19674.1 hypothetical protein GCM10025862_16950 [Arsenicicoccus piscis]